MKFKDLQPDPENPREISGDALEALKKSLHEFGDLSGIVFNERTGELVAGHQRVKSLRDAHEIDDNTDIADGITLPSGDVLAVRVVDWPRERQRLANIVANSPFIAGNFTDAAAGMIDELEKEFPEVCDELFLGALHESIVGDMKAPPDSFPEYDESVADTVDYHECPECGHKWPK